MKNLTVIFTKQKGGSVLARGICEDETVFEHANFESISEFASYAQRVLEKEYVVTYNCPDDWRLPRCITKDCRRVVAKRISGIHFACAKCFSLYAKMRGY